MDSKHASAEPIEGTQPTPARSPENGDRPFNVYVKSFSIETDDAKLEDIFSEFGRIQSCTVLRDHSGKSKQVGFVQFSSDEEATSCVEAMHGKEGYGPKPLHVALTNPKPPRTPKKTLSLKATGHVSFDAAVAPHAYTAVPMPQACMYPGNMAGWSPNPGVPLIVFPSMQPYPGAAAYGQATNRAPGFENRTSPPASEAPAMYPPAPFMVPFAPGPAGNMVIPVRPVRVHATGFNTGFCSPPAAVPAPAVAWAAPFAGPMVTPIKPAKTHFVS